MTISTLPQDKLAKILNAHDISLMLDCLDEAVFLIGPVEARVAAANAKATELTAFTRIELAQMGLKEILSFGETTESKLATRNPRNRLPIVKIKTRNHNQILAHARTFPINPDWKLIALAPIQSSTEESSTKELNKTLESILAILAAREAEPNTNLARMLEIGSNLLEAASIAIYIGNEQKPSARKTLHYGQPGIFPDEIFSSEITKFLEPTLWTRDQRAIVSFLHQSARKAGLAYLATTPIGDGNATIGILAAGGFLEPNSLNFRLRVQILGKLISNFIADGVLVENLEKTNQEKDKALTVADTINSAIREGIVVVGAEMKIQEFNRAAEMILGYAKWEVQDFEVDNVFIGTDRLIPALQHAFNGITTPNLGDVQLHRRDGSAFPAKIKVSPIQFNDQIMGAIISLQDRSEHEQFRIRSNQLEQRALLGEVTSVFAHEVRNPINNISTGLQLMADGFSEDDPNQEIVTRLQHDCTRLTDLMESVLAFSRTGSYILRPLHIQNMIEKLLKLWSPRMDRLNIKRHVASDATEYQVMGDLRALEQVFTNIISNAIQAMQETEVGGHLGIKFSSPQTTNGLQFIQVDISDTGPGIPTENVHRIFDPFFSTKKDGTGLGLAITKQIITAHKGSINLTTFPGGSVFHIKLPTLLNTEANP